MHMKTPKERTNQQKKRIGIAVLLSILVFTALVTWFIGVPMTRLAADSESFRLWVEERKLLGQFAYMGMVFLQVIVAIIPGEPLEIAGGYAFGTLEGSLLCLVASTLGSLFVFLLVKRFGVHLVEIFFSREKLQSIDFLKSSPKGSVLFLVVFMIPGTPKDLLCYFAGLTDLKLSAFLLISSLGRLPSIITSTVGGDALGTKSYWSALLVFGITFAVSILGLLIYYKMCKVHNTTVERRKHSSEHYDAQE